MAQLPFELIVLLETDKTARRLAEEITRRWRRWGQISKARYPKGLADGAKVSHAKYKQARKKFDKIRFKWSRAYPEWHSVNVRDLEKYLNGPAYPEWHSVNVRDLEEYLYGPLTS